MLAARLVALGAIPIAVFCAVYVLARAFLGLETVTQQAWVLTMALIGSVASLFLLASLAARAVVGEVEAVREAVRHVAGPGVPPPLPELTPPLEELKQEVLNLAHDYRGQHGRLQERLDTARQQIFFLTNHDALTGAAQPQGARGAPGERARHREEPGQHARAALHRHRLLPSHQRFLRPPGRRRPAAAHRPGDAGDPARRRDARAHRRRRVRRAARELQRGIRPRRGHAAARRGAVVAVRMEREGIPGGRERGRGRDHAARAQPLGDPLGSRHRVLHREGAGAQPRVRLPRRELLAVHAPDEPRVAEAHQRRAHRGRLHAPLPADRADRRAAASLGWRAWRRCCA